MPSRDLTENDVRKALLLECGLVVVARPCFAFLFLFVKEEAMTVAIVTPEGLEVTWPQKVLLLGYGLGAKAQHQRTQAGVSASNVT